MLKIKGVSIRNWMTVAETDLLFPDTGFVHVLGVNRTSGKVASIGAGKSALGDAVHRVLFDVAGRFTNYKDCSRNGDGDTYIRVECELRGTPFVVESGYKCKELSRSGEGLRYTVGSTVVEMDSVRNTRAALAAALDISPELAEWTVAVDGDRMKFGKLSQQTGVSVVMAALQQPDWTAYHDKAKAVAAGYEAELVKAEATVSACKSVAAQAESDLRNAESAHKALLEVDLSALERDSAGAEESVADLTEAIASDTREIAAQHEQNAERRGQLEKERLQLRSELSGLEDELERVAEVETLKRGLVPGTCRECRQQKPPISEAEVTRINAAIAKHGAVRAKSELTALIREVRDEMDAKSSKMASLGLAETREASQRIQSNTRLLSAKRALLTECRQKLSAHAGNVAAKADRIAMCRELLGTRKASIAVAETARLEAASATVFGDYWKAAFAPSGIPNMVLQQNIPALNALAGQVSQELTGGVLKVEFSGEVGLASGDTRNKLNIKASNRYGGPKVEGSSKGETGLINVVLAETLARIGGIADRIKWRWFDETINAQDPVVRSNILSWLRTRSEGGLVFLVDHHAEVENYATHRLVAEKSQSGVTSYRWE